MPKGFQNDDKMDAKIDVFAYFFSKGENDEKTLLICVKSEKMITSLVFCYKLLRFD